MTVTYSSDIATARFTTLFKLLFLRWRGSVMKLIWKHLLIYLALYYTIFFIGTYRMDEVEHTKFKALVTYFKRYSDAVPLSFVLGFFVTNVMTRWWDQFKAIPWPYTMAVYVSSNITGYDEVGRAMRRTIMRYVCLSLTMVFRVLSPRVKARFPKFSDLVDAGLLTKSELKIIEQMEVDWPGYSKNWVPIVWASALVNRARAQGRIRDDFMVKTLIKELNRFRGLCGDLLNYNAICIPLVYIQVVTIAVYSYFIGSLFSHQFIKSDDQEPTPGGIDYIPVLTTLQFIFYMGWLKVAETMMNPFGEDDDDFEVNKLIDHNMIMSYLIVDEMHNEHPELLKDQYWDAMPGKLPDRVDNVKSKNFEMTEIFDVAETKKEKRTNSVYYPPDLESAKSSGMTLAGSVSDADLIPRANIDENYLKVQDVDIKQNTLEREMKKRREKMSGEGESTGIESPTGERRGSHNSANKN